MMFYYFYRTLYLDRYMEKTLNKQLFSPLGSNLNKYISFKELTNENIKIKEHSQEKVLVYIHFNSN